MSKLDEMIRELCPEGVEYKPLGGEDGICDVLPSGVDKVVTAGERHVKLCNYMDVYNNQYITESLIPSFMDGSVTDSEYEKFVLREGQVLLTKDSETKEDIAQTAYVCGDFNDAVCGYHVAVLTPKGGINGKYLNYVLQSIDLRTYFSRMANGVSRYGLKLQSIEKARIPVPPLPVQENIVYILDRFIKLEAKLEVELEAELEARKRQHECYRTALLSFDSQDVYTESGPVRWLTLNEVAVMKRGTYVTQKDIVQGEIPVILGGQEPAYYCNQSNHDGEAIVISRSGAYAGFISYWNQPIFVTDGFIIEANDGLKMKYLYHYLRNKQDALHQMKRGGGVPHVRGTEIMQIKVPVPSPDDQERIADILDRYDALTNDITSSLSGEIESRRKQYEYYRDKLLTFKEKTA